MEIFREFRFAARGLVQSPGFTVAAVVTLALGIAVTTAVFSVVHGVLVEPLPYADPDRLTFVWSDLVKADYRRAPISGPELADLRQRSRLHESFGSIWATGATLVEGQRPEALRVGMVTANFLPTLGAVPQLGRAFSSADEGPGAAPRVIVSAELWQGRFGGDPGLVGRDLRIDGGWGFPGGTFEVVGVMPAGFRMLLPADSGVPQQVDVWVPFRSDLAAGNRAVYYLRTVGRLAPGVNLAQAQQEIAAIGEQIEAEHLEYAAGGRSFYAVGLHADAVRDVRPAVLTMFVGVCFVLLIACANVAGLLLVRAARRRPEVSIRAALGASRWRIARQLLVESTLLAGLGGALGVLIADLALELLPRFQSGLLPRAESIGVDGPVLFFALAASFAAALLFGCAPVLGVCRRDLVHPLREAGRGGGSSRARARALLVVGEVAIGVVLLIGAGLLTRTFLNVLQVDPGFRSGDALSFRLSLPGARYGSQEALARFSRELDERLLAHSQVTAVGAINQLPLADQPNWSTAYLTRGDDPATGGREADARVITPGYFDAIRARRVRGRFFERADNENGRTVVIVDELLARQAWPEADPLGQELRVDLWGGSGFESVWAEVVGVVGHIRHHKLTATVRGQVFAPYAQGPRNQLGVVVRTDGDPRALVDTVRRTLAEIDPVLAMADVRPFEGYADASRAPARLSMVLAGVFGALALVLACIGLYGVVAYAVSQRTREIGVRRALGAETGTILRDVLGPGTTLVLAGTGLGLVSAVVLTRLIDGLLFGVRALDAVTFLTMPAALVAAALLACWIPAWRATRIDPAMALRQE